MESNLMTNLTSTTSEEEYVEPTITSNDPEERKLARRLRISRRLEAIERQNMSESQLQDQKKTEKLPYEKQIDRSAELLVYLIQDGEENVKNVRVASDTREVTRREEDGLDHEKIMQKLEAEGNTALTLFQEITSKWQEILQHNDPLDINDLLTQQKARCEELIKQKDEIITRLYAELDEADVKFNKDQSKQIGDIETLTDRIERQVKLMLRAHRTELQLIEDSMEAYRKTCLEANLKKWEVLHRQCEVDAEKLIQDKYHIVEDFENKLKDIRVDYEETFRQAKISLETDIQELQQELQNTKALCLMNAEKMGYNYQILKKREDENIIIKNQQKKKIRKLVEMINELRKSIRDHEKKINEEMINLSAEMIKTHGCILDIEEKADHFARVNDKRFHEVWDLNEKTANKTLEKILTTDRLLHEHQLGLTWAPPEQKLLEKSQIDSFRPPNLTMPSQAESVPSQLTKVGSECNTDKDKLTKHLLEQICRKADFLIEERLVKILEPYHCDEKNLVQIDNIFRALNVAKVEDIDTLLNYFLPYAFCTVCLKTDSSSSSSISYDYAIQKSDSTISEDVNELENAKKSAQQELGIIQGVVYEMTKRRRTRKDVYVPSYLIEGERSKDDSSEMSLNILSIGAASTVSPKAELKSYPLVCKKNHLLKVNTVFILPALRKFVVDFAVTQKREPTLDERLTRNRLTSSRTISRKDIVLFWDCYQKYFTKEKEALWDGLHAGLLKYYAILKDRHQLNIEVQALRKENKKLHQLYSAYNEQTEILPSITPSDILSLAPSINVQFTD